MNHWTVQLLIDCDIVVSARCGEESCRRHSELNLMRLKTKLGPDASAMHKDLAPRLRCKKCGNGKVGLGYSPKRERTAGSEQHSRYDPLRSLRSAGVQFPRDPSADMSLNSAIV